jgi:hypothetical protein
MHGRTKDVRLRSSWVWLRAPMSREVMPGISRAHASATLAIGSPTFSEIQAILRIAAKVSSSRPVQGIARNARQDVLKVITLVCAYTDCGAHVLRTWFAMTLLGALV